MAIRVHVPPSLREHCAGAGEIELASGPATVAEALAALFVAHPGLRDRLVDERGRLREHVALFVGPESVRTAGGLQAPVDDGAELTILPAVSGG